MAKKPGKLDATAVRNRVVEVKRMRFGEVKAHGTNPKDHMDYQRNVFRDAVQFVGFGTIPVAYYSERNGGALTWVDGHLRGDELPDYEGEVAILDITDEEAAFMLSTLDPIAALAQTNSERMAAILGQIHTDSDTLNEFLDSHREQAEEELSEVSDGSLLSLTNVTIADPTHVVGPGDVWTVGGHVLICAEVLTDWPVWVPYLKAHEETALFVPYPGPYAPVASKAEQHTMIMVQPDPYIAGHIIDRYAELHGEETVARHE